MQLNERRHDQIRLGDRRANHVRRPCSPESTSGPRQGSRFFRATTARHVVEHPPCNVVPVVNHEAISAAYGQHQVVQVRRRLDERKLRSLAVQPACCQVGLEQCDLPLHGSADATVGITNPCDGSLVNLGPGQQQVGVSLPADAARLQRHDHMAVGKAGVRTSEPMSEKTLTPEQARAQLDLLTPEDVEGALGECQRELQVRERCYPRWTEEGKMSRIDAKDRMERQIQAAELLALLLDKALGTA